MFPDHSVRLHLDAGNYFIPMWDQWCLHPRLLKPAFRHIWVKCKMQAFKSRLSFIISAERGYASLIFLVRGGGFSYVCIYFSFPFQVYQFKKKPTSKWSYSGEFDSKFAKRNKLAHRLNRYHQQTGVDTDICVDRDKSCRLESSSWATAKGGESLSCGKGLQQIQNCPLVHLWAKQVAA